MPVTGTRKKVFVGMSGGVDSSVTAMLMRDRGYETVGVFMRCYNVAGCAERDAEDARRVAERLGIPFYVWDFEEAYKRRVVDYMIEGYRAGITPNPDVMCNREIKFGLFLEKALAAGADFVATGHYVRLVERGDGPQGTPTYALAAAEDENKDQSYFLWTLGQDELRHCLFPIGDYRKADVRAMARAAGLPTADKKDSQGICFIGQVSIADFLKAHISERRGELVTTDGRRVGEHAGAEFYTIGQRHIDADFAFPKQGNRNRAPFYVARKDAATNTVVLAEGSDHEELFKKDITLVNLHLMNPSSFEKTRPAGGPSTVFARVRYRQPLARATLASGGGSWTLSFDEPQKFVAPGQSAVFYDESGEMLGGGIIS
ncbi:MAG TPA: tRNA 2-thiouridine(34) synthase MnmA [Candidatus Paceibacterota bacterium]|nr:tRNA 2-thiouridine(34) synthase MnmA [Candidatus Paceibacterota bacterium]